MAMDRVVIGVDPHTLPVTIEARDNREVLRATGQFGAGGSSCRQVPGVARQWPERIWAVEGANGIGRPLTQRLLASGERVLDVPGHARRPRSRLRHRAGTQDRRHRRARHRDGGAAG
jgi:transposase